MMEKVLVTGAGGLIGRALAARLRNDSIAFVGIDHVPTRLDGEEVIECDVRDTHRLHAIARDENFTAIAHCGAYSGPMLGTDNPAAVEATLLTTGRRSSISRLRAAISASFRTSPSSKASKHLRNCIYHRSEMQKDKRE